MKYSDFATFIFEGLTHKDPVEKWIAVFKKSTHPKFKDKTPAQREKMARAAQYRAVQNKDKIKEGIRMGAKNLAIAPKKNYTVGFEFEVVVDNDFADVFSPGDYDIDDEDAWEEFQEYWYRNSSFDFDDWFKEHFLRSSSRSIVALQQLLNDNDIMPKYGRYPTADEIAEIKNYEETKKAQRLFDELSEDEKNRSINFMKNYKEDPDVALKDLDGFALVVYLDQIRRGNPIDIDVIQRRTTKVLKKEGYSKLKSIADKYFNILKDIFFPVYTADDIDTTKIEYVFDDDGNIIDIDDIYDLDDFLKYFDIDEDDLKNLTEEEWQEAEQNDMHEAFLGWRSKKPSSGSKIGYVSSLIKKEFNVSVMSDSSSTHWAVVEESTPGVDAEITSPAFSINAGIDAMKRVFELIQTNEYISTSSATGLHINFGTFTEEDLNKIDLLKFLMVLNAERILKEFDRVYNQYAPDKLPSILLMMQALKNNNISDYLKNVKETNELVSSQSSKFSAINLSKLDDKVKIIELRAPGNKMYETKGAYLEQSIRRVVRALEIASDPNQYRKEYILMLSKRFGKDIEKRKIDPLDAYFDKTFGFFVSRTLLSPISALLNGITRAKYPGFDPDKGYTLQIHKDFMKLVKEHVDGDNKEQVLRDIKNALSYDKSNKMKNSKMLRAIMSDISKIG